MGFHLFLAITVLVVSLYFYVLRKKSQSQVEKFQNACAKYDYANQSAEIKVNGVTSRISKYVPRDKQDPNKVLYATHYYEQCRTLNDVMPNGARLTISGKCVGSLNESRTGMVWITFQEVLRRTKHFADGLLQLGLAPQATFGIYSMNSPEYTIAEYSCYRHSIVVIPIYETLGSNICAFIAKQAKLTVIFCDTLVRAENVLKNANDFEYLKHIIVSHPGDSPQQFASLKAKAESIGLTLRSMQEVEHLGASNPQLDQPPKPEDLAVICYTSGTTDAPKGVMLTHENVVANFSTIQFHLDDYYLGNRDTLISYLPLGHMFERVCESGVLAGGGKIGYFSGDIKRLSDDMKIIRPTMFPCVPRVLNKIYAKIYETVSSSTVKSTLLKLAYESKRRQLHNRVFNNHSFWDILVFNKVRALLGGRVRIIPVGSAPLNGKVLDFLRCALGCHILEGYGQTECVAASSVTLIGDYSTDHVGVPLNAAEIKLMDVPEMGYFVAEGKGEVLIRGSIVFKGYYMDPKKTQETINSEGWLCTGDIARFNENGTLKIIDRKKDIFKLAQGEYIAPGKIEDVYAQSPYILQVFVYGDSYKSCLIGIVVPNFPIIQEVFRKKADGLDIDFNNNDELRSNKAIKSFIMDEMSNLGKLSNLKSFEKVKDVFIFPEGFTIEAGLLTPTLKNKRFALKAYFKNEIEELYSHLE